MRSQVTLAALFVASGLAGCTHDRVAVATVPVAQARPRPPQARPADSREIRFLAALEQADSIEIVSLASREAEITRRSYADNGKPDRGSEQWFARNEAEIEAAWCTPPNGCLEGNRVLGRLAVTRPEDRRALIGHMRQWLAYDPSVDFACIPEYRHAVEFVTAGVRRRLPLCYQCGQFQMREEYQLWDRYEPRDDSGSAGLPDGHAWFAERFAAAGIPVDVPPRD
jgi:hypothetical protein